MSGVNGGHFSVLNRPVAPFPAVELSLEHIGSPDGYGQEAAPVTLVRALEAAGTVLRFTACGADPSAGAVCELASHFATRSPDFLDRVVARVQSMEPGE